MKRIGLFFVAMFCFLLVMAPFGMAQRFSSNDRRAVVLEAFYALRTTHDGGCSIYISGDCVSNWNFLADTNYPGPLAYSTLKTAYGCNSSDWAVSGDPCPNDVYYTVPSFYSNLSGYGFSTASGSYGNLGRGGQCTFFANLLLYRSESDMTTFPLLSTMWADSDSNLQDAVEGDVIQVYGDGSPGFGNHVAVVVQIYRTGSTITALDTIDSNYITDLPTNPSNREVIARHAFCTVSSGCPFSGVQMIQGHYHIWKGTSYYSEPYNPNV